METLEQILRRHARKYPMMQPTDAVKLIYQNVFGGGHLIKDREACLRALQREYENTPQEQHAPLLESIGNGLVRVMLNAVDANNYSIRQLGEDFIRSSQEHKGNLNGFLIKLEILRKVTDSGVFEFTLEELETYIPEEQILHISVKKNKGFDALIDALKNMFLDGHAASADDALLGNTRHKDALYRAKEAMEHCMETITMRMPEDFISLDLQDANRALGEITGDTSDDEIIDRIFTKFCLGK